MSLIMNVVPILAEDLTTSTSSPAASVAVDEFMFTKYFKKLLVGFIQDDTLTTLRLTTKEWKPMAEEVVAAGVESCEIIVHSGKDVSKDDAEA
ncbi:hypothetical protein TrLO_g5355 [Triparma laevis f. longispina]|uniref:Uncharacterized protein n=1 Tax=Triparma laevis f. longispina TaxID=1714387 RepID=A0A9W7KYT8_9STRA|nr:hypothetical protein TrLO_g5355 [Triparma laevis f. longispina]